MRWLSPGQRALPGFSISPDGEWVALVSGGQLRKVALGGGPMIAQHKPATSALGIAWEGTRNLIVGEPTRLVRVPAAGGDATPLTRVDAQSGEVDHRTPFVTRDGALLACTSWSGSTDTARVRLCSLEIQQSEPTPVTIGRTLRDAPLPKSWCVRMDAAAG